MSKTVLRSLLLALLAASALSLLACGDSSDPAGDGGNNGGTNNADNNSNNSNNSNNNNPDPNNNNPDPNNNNPDPNNNNPDPNNNNPDPNNNNPDPNNNNPENNNGGECSADTSFAGQVFEPAEADPLNPNGGTPTTTAWGADFDSGIDDLLAEIPDTDEDDDNTEEEENSAAVDIQVEGATVVATYFNSANQPVPRANREFWIGDGKGYIKIFFPAEGSEGKLPPFDIKVGQTISLQALKVTNFGGVPEITDVDGAGWSLDGEGGEVYIDDRTGDSITLEDVNRVVRVTGTLTGGTACGAEYLCYDMDFGSANTVVLRTNSQFVQEGDCVTFVGPVGVFGGVPQLNVANFDWLRSPFRE